MFHHSCFNNNNNNNFSAPITPTPSSATFTFPSFNNDNNNNDGFYTQTATTILTTEPASPCSTPRTRANLEQMLLQFDQACTIQQQNKLKNNSNSSSQSRSTSPLLQLPLSSSGSYSGSGSNSTSPTTAAFQTAATVASSSSCNSSPSSSSCISIVAAGNVFQPSMQCMYQMQVRRQMELLTPVDNQQHLLPRTPKSGNSSPLLAVATATSASSSLSLSPIMPTLSSSSSQTLVMQQLQKHELNIVGHHSMNANVIVTSSPSQTASPSSCGMQQVKDEMIHNILQVALQKRKKLKQRKLASSVAHLSTSSSAGGQHSGSGGIVKKSKMQAKLLSIDTAVTSSTRCAALSKN